MKIIGANVTGSFILNSQDVTTTIQTSNVWSGSIATDINALNRATASLNVATASLNVATASLNAATASLFNYTASNNAAIADILLETASFNAFSSSIFNYTASNNAAIVDILLETASINAFSSSILNYTASTNASISDILLETASINLATASLLSYTASQNDRNGTYATTGSNTFAGIQTVNSNLVVTGLITAQTLVVQTITSSQDFVTGSTKFGSVIGNTHQFTGSVSVSGSVTATSFAGSGANLTSIPNAALTNSTISGIALGSNLATLTISTGLSGTSYNGSGAVTIANTGVTSNVAGTGISVSGATGAVTITNSGVTSIVAGTNISISGATGAVTITNGVTNNNQLTNGAGYITGYTETDTLGSVTNRGNSTSQNVVFSNGRKGLVGVYNPAQTQAVFAMGIDYVLTDGGSSSNIGNHYGLGWSYNPDYAGAGNNPQSKAGLNHQLLHMQAGVTTTAIGSGIWTAGNITATGDITAYFSDMRLKTKISNINNALDKVMKLNGFYYVNNDVAKEYGYTSDKVQIGVSAQEVESILPEIVMLAPFDATGADAENPLSKSGEHYKTVKYDKLVPLLIEAIKEQQTQIEELKTLINGLTK